MTRFGKGSKHRAPNAVSYSQYNLKAKVWVEGDPVSLFFSMGHHEGVIKGSKKQQDRVEYTVCVTLCMSNCKVLEKTWPVSCPAVFAEHFESTK